MVKECASKKFTEQVQKSAVKQPRKTLFVADSHRYSVDFKSVQKVLGGELCVAPAYNSDQWPKSLFPHKSQKVVVSQNLALASYSDMTISATLIMSMMSK